MLFDILLQVGLILLMIYLFLAMHGIPNKVLSKIRYRNRADFQAKRHFVLGAQLLARARSSKNRSDSTSLAKEALEEAEKAIAFDPKDAAAHILKSLALDFQGFKTSALDSLDAALSPLCAKSLSDQERGDALFKRAELKVAIARRGRTDSAVADLEDAVTLSPENAKAFRLLGECYEGKKMKEEAKKAYEDALRVEPELTAAREALDRLGS
ncbi:anaphase-promoting complex subunit 7-like [Juglans microcarpa x Juglans regia]|uniref:anaphase-promoting complex subunit 7-like n=1 Tax=Juglans microcarpa x Juglans regia TaxID=2249226 RepID=UPI001B7EB17A|nr:anaphase-promoting complex subunit 7-like [Juglans microcarpa x Juglans regia]